MSPVEANPPIPHESKSAKKKKAKAEAAAKDNAPPASVESDSTKPNAENTTDASYESPYMKELYKFVEQSHYLKATCGTDISLGASVTSRRSWYGFDSSMSSRDD